MKPAIILFAHGSRDPLWRLPIEAVAAEIQSREQSVQVRCAYLELCLPSLPQAAAELVAAGVRHIRIFPLFLGVGKHAREDLPLIIEEIRSAHPDLQLALLPTAGESPQLTALMADIALA
jgi:sirohydrochlorin cobaltochelatase